MVRRIFDSRLMAFDFNPANLLFGVRWPGDIEGFYLVDGFGDKKRVSDYELFPSRGARKIVMHLRKIAWRTPLVWDKNTLQFSNPT